MRLLDAINLILPVLGEHPVTSIDQRHPTIGIILPIIEAELHEQLLNGWWFNEFPTTFYPDTEGEIAMGTDTLAFYPQSKRAVARGKRLFNVERGDFYWPAPVKGRVVVSVPFEELPESVARMITYSTLLRAYATDIGVESQLEVWQGQFADARFRAEAEHLRNKHYSTARSRRFTNLRRALRT